MKPIFECFLAVVFLLAPAVACAQTQPKIRVVVFGDSLTSGYQMQPEEAFPARLDRMIKEYGFTNVDVVNMSMAGETTALGLSRLDSLLQQHPDIVVLALGTNDAMRGIGTNIIQHNLDAIIDALEPSNPYIVLVGAKAPRSMGMAYAQQLDQVYRDTAGHYKLPLYPYILDGISGHQDLSMADGLHPNPKGVDVMVQRIYPLVDTGLRWKLQVMEYQQQYRQYQEQQQAMPPS